MIAGSKVKSGKAGGGQKSDRKLPKMGAQGAIVAALVFCIKVREVERENGGLGFCYFC